MPSTATDRIDGLTTSVAIKAPCRVATTANIALSGLQTIDGVTVAAEDRVLVKNQAAAAENGIWIAQSTAWSRARDFNGARDAVKGTLVPVHSGTANARSIWQVDVGDPVYIGTTELSFAMANDVNFADALAAPPGSSLVGFSHAETYAAGTVGAKLQKFIFVTDAPYNADNTGATDATSAIQAAVDAISSVGTIYFPAGAYDVSGEILIPAGKSVSLIGAGKGSTVINGELAAADSAKSVIHYTGTLGNECEYVTIADLTVNARNFGKGIKAVYCYPKLTIRDVNVWKPVDDGIYLEECWGASTYDTHIDGDNASQGSGIYIVNANAVCLYNPRIYNMKNSVQSRAIYATSAENFNIYGGNIENCPRGIHVTLVTTFCGPVIISGVYFEPRSMQPWDAGQPNDHIYIEGDTTDRGSVTVIGCLFQAGSSGVPIAYNAVTARNLGALTLIGNTWQKAAYSAGQGTNFFVDADATVHRVTQLGNQLISTSLGNLNVIDASVLLNVSNVNDSGTNYDVIGTLKGVNIISASPPTASMYRDSIVGGSANIGSVNFGAKSDASTHSIGASITATSDGVWSGTNFGTDLSFLTAANGSTALTERLQIDAGGTIQPGADNSQNFGATSKRWSNIYSTQFRPGAGGPIWTSGTGTPEGAVTASIGSLYTRTDGGAGTTLYVKESGSGNTGWVGK